MTMTDEQLQKLVDERLAADPEEACPHDGPVRWAGCVVECLDCGETADRSREFEYTDRMAEL